MKNIIIGTFLILFPFLFTYPLQAQEKKDSVDLFSMSLEELMGIKVSVGSNVMQDKRKQPISITTISKEQLELSGARTLIDAIAIYVPGFFIVEDQDDVIAGTRGLAPDNNSKVMLLINGQNMNTEFFWGPPSAILNNTDYAYIERIEVIRGPGSVILGQGALLGVINIITKSAESFKNEKPVNGSGSGFYGKDGYKGGNAEISFKKNDFNSYISVGLNRYDGQRLREEGWNKDQDNEGYLGGKIIDIGTKLKRSENSNIIANCSYKGFNINLLYVDHKKDLYNFYRDRNVFKQRLSSAGITYNKNLTEKVSSQFSIDAADDDFNLHSVDGFTMGGFKEQRYGGKILFNFDYLIPSNYMAVGLEYKHFAMGNHNSEGHNFINNIVTEDVQNDYENYIISANENKTWGYESNLNVYSFFIEDYYTLGQHFDLFGAVRFDKHPYWGENFSPRFGVITSVNNNLIFRFAYQEGFRGAPGLHYSGGYRQDGFLRADNFGEIANAQVLHFDENGIESGIYANIPETMPEEMKSIEFTLDYNMSKDLNIYGVAFYNIIENVIDVGVIWEDIAYYSIPSIGTDIPGDWNGYWYFKNTEGSVKQAGFELNLAYKKGPVYGNLSHSFVSLTDAADQQLGSMYITQERHFKAFPENVTRLNLIASIRGSLKLGLNYMYYYKWFSPNDQEVGSNHIVNCSLKYTLFNTISISASAVNLLGQKTLYPMNSNASGRDLSDGTPALENTSFWFKLGVKF